MPEAPKTFLEYREVEERQAFDPECGISVEDFDCLIGDYHFVGDAEYPCQVVREGRRCNEDHKNGWLGRKKDGHEALIGGTCGRKQFNANLAFVFERRRLNNAHSIQTSLNRLKVTLCDPSFTEDFHRTRNRLKAVVSAVEEYRETLPEPIVARLLVMAKDVHPEVVVRFRYEDEDDNGNRTYQWVPERVGLISGLALWDPRPIRSTFAALHEIRDALEVAEAVPEAGRRKLKEWADTFDRLQSCKQLIEGLESRLSNFGDQENLKLLCLLVANQDVGVAMSAVVIGRTSGNRAVPGSALRIYNEICTAVSAKSNGRPFKV
jgi:hypothetical protein